MRAITIQLDGQILVGGDFSSFGGQNLNHIVRLNPDGSLDAAFVSQVGLGANQTVNSIGIQSDNRIVLAGNFTVANGVSRNRITRLMPDGSVDPTINFGSGANGAIDALAIQPDNMLVIGGSFTQVQGAPHAHIARLYGGSVTGSGSLQFTVGNFVAAEDSTNALITVTRVGGTSGPCLTAAAISPPTPSPSAARRCRA